MLHTTSTLPLAFASILLLPSVLAQGYNVVNNCDQTVYYQIVDKAWDVQAGSLESCESFPFGYHSFGDIASDNSTSVKLNFQDSFYNTEILQFEFVNEADGNGGEVIWYDISTVNGDPFRQYPKSVIPSYASGPAPASCVPVIANAGDESDTLYQGHYEPNYNCEGTDQEGNPLMLTMYLCSLD